MKLRWVQYEALVVKEDRWDALCAGYELTVQKTFQRRDKWEGIVSSGGDAIRGGKRHFHSEPLATMDEAQDAAEAALTRLLADDDGLRSLLGVPP